MGHFGDSREGNRRNTYDCCLNRLTVYSGFCRMRKSLGRMLHSLADVIHGPSDEQKYWSKVITQVRANANVFWADVQTQMSEEAERREQAGTLDMECPDHWRYRY